MWGISKKRRRKLGGYTHYKERRKLSNKERLEEIVRTKRILERRADHQFAAIHRRKELRPDEEITYFKLQEAFLASGRALGFMELIDITKESPDVLERFLSEHLSLIMSLRLPRDIVKFKLKPTEQASPQFYETIEKFYEDGLKLVKDNEHFNQLVSDLTLVFVNDQNMYKSDALEYAKRIAYLWLIGEEFGKSLLSTSDFDPDNLPEAERRIRLMDPPNTRNIKKSILNLFNKMKKDSRTFEYILPDNILINEERKIINDLMVDPGFMHSRSTPHQTISETGAEWETKYYVFDYLKIKKATLKEPIFRPLSTDFCKWFIGELLAGNNALQILRQNENFDPEEYLKFKRLGFIKEVDGLYKTIGGSYMTRIVIQQKFIENSKQILGYLAGKVGVDEKTFRKNLNSLLDYDWFGFSKNAFKEFTPRLLRASLDAIKIDSERISRNTEILDEIRKNKDHINQELQDLYYDYMEELSEKKKEFAKLEKVDELRDLCDVIREKIKNLKEKGADSEILRKERKKLSSLTIQLDELAEKIKGFEEPEFVRAHTRKDMQAGYEVVLPKKTYYIQLSNDMNKVLNIAHRLLDGKDLTTPLLLERLVWIDKTEERKELIKTFKKDAKKYLDVKVRIPVRKSRRFAEAKRIVIRDQEIIIPEQDYYSDLPNTHIKLLRILHELADEKLLSRNKLKEVVAKKLGKDYVPKLRNALRRLSKKIKLDIKIPRYLTDAADVVVKYFPYNTVVLPFDKKYELLTDKQNRILTHAQVLFLNKEYSFSKLMRSLRMKRTELKKELYTIGKVLDLEILLPNKIYDNKLIKQRLYVPGEDLEGIIKDGDNLVPIIHREVKEKNPDFAYEDLLKEANRIGLTNRQFAGYLSALYDEDLRAEILSLRKGPEADLEEIVDSEIIEEAAPEIVEETYESDDKTVLNAFYQVYGKTLRLKASYEQLLEASGLSEDRFYAALDKLKENKAINKETIQGETWYKPYNSEKQENIIYLKDFDNFVENYPIRVSTKETFKKVSENIDKAQAILEALKKASICE